MSSQQGLFRPEIAHARFGGGLETLLVETLLKATNVGMVLEAHSCAQVSGNVGRAKVTIDRP
jgi:hypothetical protein